MQNGCVFWAVSPPIVARRTWTLKIRPRSSVAATKSSSVYAASGNRTQRGSLPSLRA